MTIRQLIGPFPRSLTEQQRFLVRCWAWAGIMLPFIIMIQTMIVIPLIEATESVDINSSPFGESPSLLEMLILAVILAPLLEETLFRAWLTKPKGIMFAGLALFATIFVAVADATNPGLIALASGGMFILLIVSMSWNRKNGFSAPNKTLWTLGLLVNIVFGLVHLSNFPALPSNPIFLVLLVLPQLVIGCLFVAARLQVGIWGAMLLHAVYNAEIVLIAGLATTSLGPLVVLVYLGLLVFKGFVVVRHIKAAGQEITD